MNSFRRSLVVLFLMTAAVSTSAEIRTMPAARRAVEFTLQDVVTSAVSPFDQYCDGYGNPGARGLGYISVLTLGTGRVKKDMDQVLDGIVSYDRAETNDAYIGQINMLYASSFNGLNGAVWGYHLARADALADGTAKPLFHAKRADGVSIPVYSADPLLDAGRRLFGVNRARRFPLLPGAQVICAAKELFAAGPCQIWSAIAIAMAEDRDRDANLFIEDCGQRGAFRNERERRAYFERLVRNIVKSVMRCGEDSDVKFKEIFVSYRTEWVPKGEVGCALVAAPYLTLARQAIPASGAGALLKMTISDWERAVGLLPASPAAPPVAREINAGIGLVDEMSADR